MAASELNDRLDYLISYSSQLVFVCSDKIKQQSHVVESYLAYQNEQADLALLTANELTPLVTYREKLFRQLVSQSQEADFNRPLNQLLAPLNNHNGSILISVFQAEKLPNKLVKELWDLVLQSRFANNKQHLNVLLMGLSDWAETAKSGLGAKSKGQPIMLNSQSDIQQTEGQGYSDVESFIQDKRKKFAKRIEERHQQTYVSQSIYKKFWVAILFALVFLALFGGMLSLQYPDKANLIMSYFNNQESEQQPPSKPSNDKELEKPMQAETIKVAPQSLDELAPPTMTPAVKEESTKALLVTDWSTASAQIEAQSNKVLLKTSLIDEPEDLLSEQSIKKTPPAPVETLAIQRDIVNDYQVEDIVEVGSILQQQKLQPVNSEQPKIKGLLSPEPNLLMALPTDNFVIQIAAMANLSLLRDYIKEEQLGQQLWLYKTQRYGGDWYVLLKSQHFPSIEDARVEIIKLANAMLKNSPFVKSLAQVKREISISGP